MIAPIAASSVRWCILFHLRNVKREADGSRFEAEHLDGDNDMVGLISALLDEQAPAKLRATPLANSPCA